MNLDEALERLATEPVPSKLVELDGTVLLRIADHRFERSANPDGTRTAIIAIALAMGVVGGLLPDTAAIPRDSYASLTGVDRFAPSRLLAGPQ